MALRRSVFVGLAAKVRRRKGPEAVPGSRWRVRDSHGEYSGPVLMARVGRQRFYRRVRGSLPSAGGKSQGPCLRYGSLSGLFHGNQLLRSVTSVCCDALEPGLGGLGAARPLFYDLAGLRSLEQAGACDDARSNAQARARGELVVCIFFAHRSKIYGFQLYDDHRQSLSILCPDGRRSSALSARLVSTKDQARLASSVAPEVSRARRREPTPLTAWFVRPIRWGWRLKKSWMMIIGGRCGM